MRSISLLIVLTFLIPTLALALKTQTYRLPNGLKIIVREDHRAPVVLSSVWYKVGGSYESNGYTGISHVLEHMMFKGTALNGPGVFNRRISLHGGIQNAVTSRDYTAYYQEISSDQLELCLQLESDRMMNLSLDPAEFIKEKQVVMEERGMRVDNNPRGNLWERFNAAAFVNNPYHHPVVGWMTDLKNLKVKDVKQWYTRWYAPNNAVLIVIGDIDSDHVFALAQKYFGPLKAALYKKLKPRIEIPSLGEKTVKVHTHASTASLIMGFNVPSIITIDKKNIKDIYALKVMSSILSGGQSARLNKKLVREKQIAMSVSSGYDPYALHQTAFVFTGIPSPNTSLKKLKSAILNQVEELKLKPVAPSELKRVKAQLLANDVYQHDSLMDAAFSIGPAEMLGLSWRDADELNGQMMKVKPSDIQRVANRYFTKMNITVGNLIPKKRHEK